MEYLSLHNVRNSCYINSSLQMLFSIIKFRDFILQKRFLEGQRLDKTNQSLCIELYHIFIGHNVNAEKLRAKIANFSPAYSHFNDGSMQDSEEFLRVLFHILQNELNANVEGSELLNSFNGSFVNVRKFLDSPTGGCSNCGQFPSNQALEEFTVLSLNINDEISNLSGLINHDFGHSEVYQAKCSNCCVCPSGACICINRPVSNEKQLIQVPDFLLVKLLRYDPQGRKNSVYVESLNDFNFEGTDFSYKLTCIVDHIGHTLSSGHWIMHTKSNDRWTTCNDNSIRRNRIESTIKTRDNILFLYSQQQL